MTKYFPGLKVPLDPYLDGFRKLLTGLGYAPSTVQQVGSLASRLSRWLELHGLAAGALTDEVLKRFLDDLISMTRQKYPTAASFVALMDYLRQLEVVPVPVPPRDLMSEERIVLRRFERYLVEERGLTVKTVEGYCRTARQVLDWLIARSSSLGVMGGADVISFTTELLEVVGAKRTKRGVTGLRSFLGWAFMDGLCERSMAAAVPSVAGHDSNIPQGLSMDDTKALLGSCDLETFTGRRDYAVLVLMVRLGLRANEVAVLSLHDVDWRAGEILIQGKGRCQEKLPLPQDVGTALADYLRHDRPAPERKTLFLRVHAPIRALASAGVSEIVLAASKRAGLTGVHAHQLRHTAATDLLRAGSSLAEVGQVLRHRSLSTTAQYAKVDYVALRALALPWPGSKP